MLRNIDFMKHFRAQSLLLSFFFCPSALLDERLYNQKTPFLYLTITHPYSLKSTICELSRVLLAVLLGAKTVPGVKVCYIILRLRLH